MKDSKHTLSSLNAENLSDDELDALFGQLEQFQPPETLVSNIMATVSQLPPFSSPYPQQSEEITTHNTSPLPLKYIKKTMLPENNPQGT